MNRSEKIVLYVIGKYNRPIGQQPLQRGISVISSSLKLPSINWVKLIDQLEKNKMVIESAGFRELTETGKKIFKKNENTWSKYEFD